MTGEVQAIRKLAPGRLVIASHNEGKVREIGELLAPHGITFVANAELKAQAAADLSGLPALADDSGLCVDALGGEPGIFSARWAGEPRDFNAAMRRVEEAIAASGPAPSRDAHFVCALALAWPDGHVEWFEGRVDGTLVWPPRGDKGFGYDAMFLPLGGDATFGEMDPAEKHAISHRADAFRQLVAAVL